ncbi:cytidine/deoxycytidylate deaminase family protein, partial [bacterium]|nr:cytidine/deoxycytidylate deaminase family protein [bacterium]
DVYFAEIADLVSSRSTCLRNQVGAVIVKESQILSTGYNGAPKGLPHCDEVGCIREELGVKPGTRHELCRGLHAEQNALIQAANYGVSTENAIMFCNLTPCIVCSKMMINAGISKIFFDGNYPEGIGLNMLEEAGVELERIEFKKIEYELI